MDIHSTVILKNDLKVKEIINIIDGKDLDIIIGQYLVIQSELNSTITEEELTESLIQAIKNYELYPREKIVIAENDTTLLEAMYSYIDYGATGVVIDENSLQEITLFSRTSENEIVQEAFNVENFVKFYQNEETATSSIFIPGAKNVSLRKGDCRELMSKIPENSIHSIVTDPPYEIGFGNKKWDSSGIAYDPKVWEEAYRILKPGGYLLAFGGTRMWHRVAVAIEDAGFEIKDNIAWMFGSGFPKTMNIELAMGKYFENNPHPESAELTEQWGRHGTAIKPAFEPIIMARKPIDGTIINTLLEHGTGALNIDDSRIPTTDKLGGGSEKNGKVAHQEWSRPWMSDPDAIERSAARTREKKERAESLGRFPTNVILDSSQAEALDRDTTEIYDPENPKNNSRFYYVAKTSRKENPEINGKRHSTVKPIKLMEYLVKLVTPVGGTVLDPFAGSGSTLEAADRCNFKSIGIELDPDGFHIALIKHRLNSKVEDETLF